MQRSENGDFSQKPFAKHFYIKKIFFHMNYKKSAPQKPNAFWGADPIFLSVKVYKIIR